MFIFVFAANQGYATKMNIQPKTRTESKGHKGSKRTSPSNQIYILSGHAKRVASALRNVFKSDAKEESSKSKEHGKYLGVDPLRTNLEIVSVAVKSIFLSLVVIWMCPECNENFILVINVLS